MQCAMWKLLERSARRDLLGWIMSAWAEVTELTQQGRRNAFFDAMGGQLRSSQRRCKMLESAATCKAPARRAFSMWRVAIRLEKERSANHRQVQAITSRVIAEQTSLGAWRAFICWHIEALSACKENRPEDIHSSPKLMLQQSSNAFPQRSRARSVSNEGLHLSSHSIEPWPVAVKLFSAPLDHFESRRVLPEHQHRSLVHGLYEQQEHEGNEVQERHEELHHLEENQHQQYDDHQADHAQCFQGELQASQVPLRESSSWTSPAAAPCASLSPRVHHGAVSSPLAREATGADSAGGLKQSSSHRGSAARLSIGINRRMKGGCPTQADSIACASREKGLLFSSSASPSSRRDTSPPSTFATSSGGGTSALSSSLETPRWMDVSESEPCSYRGPARFFYDTKTYTGCARYGGPCVMDRRSDALRRSSMTMSAPRGRHSPELAGTCGFGDRRRASVCVSFR